MNGMNDILTFLAGAGIGPLLEQLTKMMPKQERNPNTASAQLPHRPGLRMGMGGPPGTTTIQPSMLQALLQQAQGGGQQNPQALLAQLAQGGGGQPA